MIERVVFKELYDRDSAPKRKPVLIQGARQVGKSYAVKAYAHIHKRKLHTINFLFDKQAITIFNDNLEPNNLIDTLEYYLGESINTKEDILFLDEIQECPRALTACKAFYEGMPELRIVYAGSYVGLMQENISYPVGSLSYMRMTPLTFSEFLRAIDVKLFTFYEKIDLSKMTAVDEFFHTKLLESYKLYLSIGGMPEIVQNYIDLGNSPTLEILKISRVLQQQLLDNYKGDFSKHAGKIKATHILHVYEAIASQLQKSHDQTVDKFAFSSVIPNQKGYAKIVGPLTWLAKSRLVIQNFMTSQVTHPLPGGIKHNFFKLFMHDIGLLHAATHMPISIYMQQQNLGSYTGFIIENAIAIELFARGHSPLYSYKKNKTEIEFMLPHESYGIIPIEVKASSKSRKSKSLTQYIKKFSPSKAYKISAQNYGYAQDQGFETIPVYLLGKLLDTVLS